MPWRIDLVKSFFLLMLVANALPVDFIPRALGQEGGSETARLLAAAQRPFRIEVVDAETGRGVPLVELTTTNHITLISDSAGLIAFDEPGLMNQRVFFSVKSHGYEYPKDGFGYRGARLDVTPGGRATVKVKRLNIAERLYRVTGGGIYHHTLRLGETPPLERPVLNGKVMGQDTVIAKPYRGKIYWFWGDTNRVVYPLGNFSASGATSELPENGGLAPEIGVDLSYFVDEKGFSKKMCPFPDPGLVWINCLMTLDDEKGRERLYCIYSRMKSLGVAYGWGVAVFNDEKEIFERVVRFDSPKGHRSAHPFRATVDGREYVYIFPNYRVKANLTSLKDLSSHEAYSPLKTGSDFDKKNPDLDRDPDGRLRYAWKKGTAPVHPDEQAALVAAGRMKVAEGWIHLTNALTGKPAPTGRSSVAWNAYRNRWITIAEWFGEVWFAEADTSTGPWVYARKIVDHDRYSFYNVTQHSFFDAEGGKRIYFEGTYTAAFSRAPAKTPRYDYNQIMYGLSLDDPRLALPVPVYAVRQTDGTLRYLTREGIDSPDPRKKQAAWGKVESVPFFALPPGRPVPGSVAVYSAPGDNDSTSGFRVGEASPEASSAPAQPLFHVFPYGETKASAPLMNATVPLYEYRRKKDASPQYSTNPDKAPGKVWIRSEKPICRVWRNLMSGLHLDYMATPSTRQ